MRYYSNNIGDTTNGHDEELERIMQQKMNEFSLQRQRNEYVENHQSTATPITLTDQNFNEMISKYPLLIVDFWAPWCGPCRMMSPIIDQVGKEHQGKLVVGKVNVDENPNVSRQFGISSIPTLILFKKGQVVDNIIGSVSKSRIDEMIRMHVE